VRRGPRAAVPRERCRAGGGVSGARRPPGEGAEARLGRGRSVRDRRQDREEAVKRLAGAFLAAAAALAVGACHSGDLAGNAARLGLGGAGGRAGDIVAAGVTSAVDLAQQQSVKLSPEQEYFLGRGVAANVIAQYGLDPDEGVQRYVRTIGA